MTTIIGLIIIVLIWIPMGAYILDGFRWGDRLEPITLSITLILVTVLILIISL